MFGRLFFLCVAIASAPFLVLIANADEDVERIPLRTYRWCPAYYLPGDSGRDEAAPPDLLQPLAKPTWIVDASVLKIKNEFPAGVCNLECRQQVSKVFVQSLNIWRHLCLKCKPGIFSVVVDDDDIYFDESVYTPLSDAKESLFNRLYKSYEASLNLRSEIPSNGDNVMGIYVRTRRHSGMMTDLCAHGLGAFEAYWPGRLKAAACEGSNDNPVPTLTLKYTFAAPCNEASFIACGKPGEGIELDLSSTAYGVRPDPRTWKGSPPRLFGMASPTQEVIDLESVFIHEIGHFLGLGHLQIVNRPLKYPAAMLAEYNKDACISRAEINLLNNATEAGWQYIAKDCGGLKRPTKGQK